MCRVQAQAYVLLLESLRKSQGCWADIMVLKSQLHKTVANWPVLGIQSRLDMVLFFRLANPDGHTGNCKGVFSFDFRHPCSNVVTVSLIVAFRAHKCEQAEQLLFWALVNPYLKDVSNYGTK